jgi:uncharacterized protein
MKHMKIPTKGLAVSTGASSGFGAVYTDRLARRGYDLLLVARNRERLEHRAKKLATDTQRNVEILAADLSDSNDLAKLEQILRNDSRITLLVNNAGMGAIAPLLNSDVADMRRMIALNIEALTRLTYAVVPSFVKRGSGTIINIGSIVGVAPERLNGVYGGTKAFVLAFSQSLRHELATPESRCRSSCPARRLLISGKSRASLSNNCHTTLSCQRKTWWMRRSMA